jgi:preprotein translocase subunit YajC
MPAGLTQFLPMIAVLVVFYLLLILPEQRRQKKFKAMLGSLNVGDEIMTKGGIYGKITNIKDDYMVIESGAERTKLKIARAAVASVVTSKEEESK